MKKVEKMTLPHSYRRMAGIFIYFKRIKHIVFDLFLINFLIFRCGAPLRCACYTRCACLSSTYPVVQQPLDRLVVAKASTKAQANPVRRVVTMLQNMQKKAMATAAATMAEGSGP